MEDLGRYLGRAEALPRGRGRNVDRLVGAAGLSGVLAFAGGAKDVGETVSLRKAERLREVRVMVSAGETTSSLARGRSPTEVRRLLLLFALMDAAFILLLRVPSLGFFAARS